jgi:hypothetical protein
LLIVILAVSTLILKVLAIDIVLECQWRQWDARTNIALSRILERIGSGTVEEQASVQVEAINLHHPSVMEPPRAMHLFRLVQPGS